MKRLAPLPAYILQRHDHAFTASIQTALDMVLNGHLPQFPKRKGGGFGKLKALNSTDIASLKEIRDLFVKHRLLTATAEQIRSNVIYHNPPLTPLPQNVIDLLLELFNYSEFQQGRILVFRKGKFYWETPDEPWGGYEYMQYHTETLKYCPYCNADTVYAFKKNNAKQPAKVVSALDHFYPKSQYPFLALSLYNLVPVCSRCNSQLKGSADMTDVANPYIEDVHRSVVFFPVIKSIQPALSKSCSVAVLPRKCCDSKAIEFVRRFELESLYSSAFSREAYLCLERVRNFTPAFRLDLARRINQSDPRLIESLLFGMSLEESEINNTRLGKMTLDIFEQFHDWQRMNCHCQQDKQGNPLKTFYCKEIPDENP